jgi:hypothetical protein
MRDLWEGRDSLRDSHCLKMAGQTSEKLNCSSDHIKYIYFLVKLKESQGFNFNSLAETQLANESPAILCNLMVECRVLKTPQPLSLNHTLISS